MAYILSIETSTTNCSVALSKEGDTIALKEDNNHNYSHAELLHQYIKEVIADAQISINQLSAIAVSKGPGSYTGLRIGVSAAKGLCFSLNIPLIAISTLESLANQIFIKQGFIVPMLDARRMEAYTAVYNFNYELVREIKAEILSGDSFEDLLKQQQVVFIGNAVNKFSSLIESENATFIYEKLPSAKDLSLLAFQQLKIGNTENVAYFEPFYLKDFIALKSKH